MVFMVAQNFVFKLLLCNLLGSFVNRGVSAEHPTTLSDPSIDMLDVFSIYINETLNFIWIVFFFAVN